MLYSPHILSGHNLARAHSFLWVYVFVRQEKVHMNVPDVRAHKTFIKIA